jgi:6-phosphogluconolactonase/glucosamine-6-phosphate isomerase/deaminase
LAEWWKEGHCVWQQNSYFCVDEYAETFQDDQGTLPNIRRTLTDKLSCASYFLTSRINQLLNQSKNILWSTQAFVFACHKLKGDVIFDF